MDSTFPNHWLSGLVLTVALIGAWGCQPSATSETKANRPKTAETNHADAQNQALSELPEISELATEEPLQLEEELIRQVESQPYEPPYPDRVNMFMPPERSNIARDSSQDSRGENIELLGFVNVDRQRAVLVINGLVVSLAEGGTDHGIEVLSIQPPAVVLQRGRQRWQAVLTN